MSNGVWQVWVEQVAKIVVLDMLAGIALVLILVQILGRATP